MFKSKKVRLSIFFGILFFLVMLLVILGKTSNFDHLVYNTVISFRNSVLDCYFITITKLANTLTIIFVVIFFALIFRNRHSLFLIVSSIDCLLLTTIFKYLIGRNRPNVLKLIEQGGYSFPSGHTMFSVCIYGYLFYLAITKIKNKILRYSVSSLLLLVILSIGVSRIYVGVHFASDVLAGYLLGCCYLLFLIEVEEKFYLKRG